MSNNITEIIFHGESTEVLKGLEDNSIDSVVCDPPYGLSKEPDISKVISEWVSGDDSFVPDGKGFMSKEWDGFVPPPSLWKEVYRVLKPGGHALVCGGTRTEDLMTISLRLAGFEVRDVIEWLYFSGFPKSHDVSKAFDRRGGSSPGFKEFARYIKKKREEAGITRKEMNDYFGYVAGCNWWESENGNTFRYPNNEDYGKLKTLLNLDERYDSLLGATGEVVEKRVRGNAGFSSEQVPRPWKDKIGESYDITAPATELARKWDGWGTALKPAHEPIIVVRKPLIDADTGRKLTVVDCVEKYGTGAINIDASRIDSVPRTTHKGVNRRTTNAEEGSLSGNKNVATFNLSVEKGDWKPNEKRFPANCITLDSDQFYSKYFNITPAELSKKASKKDRNSDWQGEEIGLDEAPTGHGNLQNIGGFERFNTVNRNNHPTVKPTDLMAWLVRLVTPPNGTVLDPFAGSGSTLVAAKREGFGFIGIELTEEYIPIIEARTGIEAETSERQAIE